MKEACALFQGTHDFTSFSSKQDARKDKVRTIFDIELNIIDKEIEFIFIGNGFLRYQIRTMIGTIIEVGLGKRTIESIQHLFELKNGSIKKYIAMSQGLYLYSVEY